MKTAFQEGLIKTKGFNELVEKVKGWGFDALEVWGEGLDKRIEEVAATLKRHNLPACSVCPGGNGIRGSILSRSEEERARAGEDIDTLIEMCARLGGAGLVLVPEFGAEKFMSLYPDHSDFEKRAEIFADRLSPRADKARKLGVTILLEPLNRYEAFFMLTVGQAARICRMMGNPSVKAMADFFHMGIEEDDSARAIRENADCLAHVHLVDSNRKLPGRGDRDFVPLLKALNESGFDGFMCLECGITGDADLEIPASLNHIKNLSLI